MPKEGRRHRRSALHMGTDNPTPPRDRHAPRGVCQYTLQAQCHLYVQQNQTPRANAGHSASFRPQPPSDTPTGSTRGPAMQNFANWQYTFHQPEYQSGAFAHSASRPPLFTRKITISLGASGELQTTLNGSHFTFSGHTFGQSQPPITENITIQQFIQPQSGAVHLSVQYFPEQAQSQSGGPSGSAAGRQQATQQPGNTGNSLFERLTILLATAVSHHREAQIHGLMARVRIPVCPTHENDFIHLATCQDSEMCEMCHGCLTNRVFKHWISCSLGEDNCPGCDLWLRQLNNHQSDTDGMFQTEDSELDHQQHLKEKAQCPVYSAPVLGNNSQVQRCESSSRHQPGRPAV